MVTVLGPAHVSSYEEHFKRLVAAPALPAFDPVIIDFIDAVSKSVLLNPAMRSMPEIMAAAHWMRRAHVVELQRAFETDCRDRVVLPRGVVVHFALSNVDSLFLYSWFISMMVGNANVVRLSSRRGMQVGVLLGAINTVTEQERFSAIQARNLILSYEHDEGVTEQLSMACHARVLWGGDDSIGRLRAIPLNALAAEIAFANRFSLAVMDAASVLSAGPVERTDLARRFFGDAYWFDQMACSSPRLVVWVGSSEACESAQRLFWAALAEEVERRGVEYPEMIGLNKQTAAYTAAATGVADRIVAGATGPITRVHLHGDAGGQFREFECGGGLFFETEVAQLSELPSVLRPRDQTISHFGFDAGDLKQLARALPTRAVDRIVPIGSALDFSPVWDGYDLFRTLSRQIDVRAS